METVIYKSMQGKAILDKDNFEGLLEHAYRMEEIQRILWLGLARAVRHLPQSQQREALNALRKAQEIWKLDKAKGE